MKTIEWVDYYEVVDWEPDEWQECYLYRINHKWVIWKYVCIDNWKFLFRLNDWGYLTHPRYRCECIFVHDLYWNRYSAYMSEWKRQFALMDINWKRTPWDEELCPDPDTLNVDDFLYVTSDDYTGWVNWLFVAKYRWWVIVNLRWALAWCELQYFPKWALKSENDDNHIMFEWKKYPWRLTDWGWYEFNN